MSDHERGISSLGDELDLGPVGEDGDAHRPKPGIADRGLEMAAVTFEVQLVWEERPRNFFTGNRGIGGSEELMFGKRNGILGKDFFQLARIFLGLDS